MAAKAATLTTRARKTRPGWVRFVKRLFATLFLVFLVAFTAFGFFFVGEMRKANELMASLPDKLRRYSTQPTKVLSRDGVVLYTVQNEFREPLKYEQIPTTVRNAIVAAEDKRFFEHNGVDYWAMGRILFVGAREGRLSQGASTLTMQLAKRFYSEGERTFQRKFQDVALAIAMERDMTKEQILTLYLNTMYFGERAYGVQAAANVYFGKDVDKLSVAEAAMLARCVRRPSDENPVANLKKSIENRNVVLGIMRDENMITQAQYDEAVAEKVHLTPPKKRITSHLNRAEYFVDHVLQTVEQEMPGTDLKEGGYTIYTTLDSKMEDFAEKKVRQFVREHNNSDDRVNDAAFVLMNRNGEILAEVGGLDYEKSQFNIVTQGDLQPGSSFKPFLYSCAFSEGALSMDDELDSMPFSYDMGAHAKPWVVHNSSPRENIGMVSVETAMALSLNACAAHVMQRLDPGGPSKVAALAVGAFGFKPFPAYQIVPSMSLGTVQVSPLEMARAYSVFMLHGSRATPHCITRIVGPDGSVIKTYGPDVKQGVIDTRTTMDVDQLLRAVVERGTGSAVDDVVPDARGKTGTTSSHKDGWFCGYTDGLVGIAWMGNMVTHKGRITQQAMGQSMWGASAAAGFWASIMKTARDRFGSPVPEPPPSTIDDFHEKHEPSPVEDQVKVVTPDDQKATTGGPGGPTVVPPQGTTGQAGGDTSGGTTGGDGTAPPPQDGGDKASPDQVPVTQPPKRGSSKKGDSGEQGETVKVEVCAESGMRATIYCPETVVRTFKKGHEPKGYCTIHGR